MRLLDHERLEVYSLARQYNRSVSGMLRRLDTAGWSSHIDQLRRAGASIALNLAEGSGEFAPKEKARFYRMAKRSAAESAAALDHLVDIEVASEADILESKHLLRRIISILIRLLRVNEPSPHRTQPLPEDTRSQSSGQRARALARDQRASAPDP